VDAITITQGACTIDFTAPNLALAWVKVLTHDMTPALFLKLHHAINPMGHDAWVTVRNLVDACLGASS
jgi:hypothetical protein